MIQGHERHALRNVGPDRCKAHAERQKMIHLQLLRHLRARPRLWWSIACGLVVSLAVPTGLVNHLEARLLMGWNACALLYLGLAAPMLRHDDPQQIQHRAIVQHEGRFVVLLMVVVSACAVLMAVASQLAVVRSMQGLEKSLHIALAAVTVLSSWLFTQTLFALHYAHEFHLRRLRDNVEVLHFPGTPEPDYADFLYFSCVIGTSGQTADVSFTDSALRRIGLVHCVLAFFFNTTVLALTINIGASLF